ncbi:MAG: biopolymer transportern ExbD [Moraxellaceae bacterium]|jgi:biopolymer transport protein ExbD|nr:biopolymer transportern ExbD [Moraxellaceae bacterium]
MARKLHYKKESPQIELDVTTFLNLMVVLIPFLLATAVFSQVNIQELNLPTQAAGGAVPDTPVVTIEVMVRKSGLEIGDGKRITNTLPRQDGKLDLAGLSTQLRDLKATHPEKNDATVLLEPDIEYNDMIAVMDAVKVYKPKAASEMVVLFPEISIGDTP